MALCYPMQKDKENIALGMIPNGIGNDFAKYWGLSTEYKPAVDCIINHRLKKIDVGYCNFYDGNEHQRRYFLNAVNMDWEHESSRLPIRPNASGV